VTVAALVYRVLAANHHGLAAPPDAAWYDSYLVILSAVLVVAVGLAGLFVAKPHERGDAPAGAPSRRRPPSTN
jgi:hypothetical protein